MTILDTIRSLANAGNGTIIGVLFGSVIYYCNDTYSRLDQPFRQDNFYRFCFVMLLLASAGAASELFYMLNHEKWNRVKYIKHADGSVEIDGEEDKVLNLLKEKSL